MKRHLKRNNENIVDWYNSVDKNQSSEIDQSYEKEFVKNFIESTILEKLIVFKDTSSFVQLI